MFESLFKSLPCFHVLETCREYFLTIDLGIVEFIKYRKIGIEIGKKERKLNLSIEY